MRKVLAIVCMVILVAIGPLTGAGMESLYPLVVPYEYTALTILGGLGSDAVQIELNLSPFNFDADIGARANYQYESQTADQDLQINANVRLEAGTSSITTQLDGNGDYKSYGLDLDGMPGFYTAAGNLFFRPSFVGGTTNIQLEIAAFGGVGLGRIYNITTIHLIELMMKHLGVTPTEENVKAAAEIIYTNQYRLNKYSEDTSRNYIEYYRALAAAMGAGDKILELIYIGQSQRFAFERNRYNNLKLGWEGQAGLLVELDVNTTTSFAAKLQLEGVLAGFTMDNRLHYSAEGFVRFGFTSDAVNKLGLHISLQGNGTYLPDNPQWWAKGLVEVLLNTALASPFDLRILAEGDFQLEPNLTLYAGARIMDLFTDYSIHAGGNYRVW